MLFLDVFFSVYTKTVKKAIFLRTTFGSNIMNGVIAQEYIYILHYTKSSAGQPLLFKVVCLLDTNTKQLRTRPRHDKQ